jgi:hypothetical protein
MWNPKPSTQRRFPWKWVLLGTVLGAVAWGGIAGAYCGLLFSLVGVINFQYHEDEKRAAAKRKAGPKE